MKLIRPVITGLFAIAAAVDFVSAEGPLSFSLQKKIIGWEFELPKGRKGFNEGTSEVSGACFDKYGNLWSIGDGGLNGSKITKTSFHENKTIHSQEIYHIASFNRDMEWMICDSNNHTLVIGDTGDNNRERGQDAFFAASSKVNKARNKLEALAQPHNLSLANTHINLSDRNRQINYWAGQLEKSLEEVKSAYLQNREARIYVYNIEESRVTRSYDGKKFLPRLGFVKLAYHGGPLDIEAAVIKKEENGHQILYLFEKISPFSTSHSAKMLRLDLSKNLSLNRNLKTAIPKTHPEEVQHLDFKNLNCDAAYITDAALSSNQDTLYLLTDNALIRYSDWTNPSAYKVGEIGFLSETISNLQMESLTLFPTASQPGKILLGSDLLNAFVSINTRKPSFWNPFFFSTEKKHQKLSQELFL